MRISIITWFHVINIYLKRVHCSVDDLTARIPNRSVQYDFTGANERTKNRSINKVIGQNYIKT